MGDSLLNQEVLGGLKAERHKAQVLVVVLPFCLFFLEAAGRFAATIPHIPTVTFSLPFLVLLGPKSQVYVGL